MFTNDIEFALTGLPARLKVLATALTVVLVFGANLTQAAEPSETGLLDAPLAPGADANPDKTGVAEDALKPVEQAANDEELQEVVRAEQEALEQLPREQILEQAEDGARAAQVVLGVDFAKEATQLSFAPVAANDALSDAIRWYSLAASRGFPGAPSLDQAGIKFYPVRLVRPAR
ncbi:MAG: hypothetical protein V3U76_11985 [Granulosicoccus sp.]